MTQEMPIVQVPTPRQEAPRPTVGTIVLVVVGCSLIGFLGGGLAAQLAHPTPAPTSSSSSSAAQQPSAAASSTAPATAITLRAENASASSGGSFRLSGEVPGASAGVTVSIEQAVGGASYQSFPVTTRTKADGTFSVRVASGRQGVNHFRVRATVDGQTLTSNSVTVNIG